VRGLLGKGRFSEVLPAARRFVELAPDLPLALELLSFVEALPPETPALAGDTGPVDLADPGPARLARTARVAVLDRARLRRIPRHWTCKRAPMAEKDALKHPLASALGGV
jgi:hypothetical protein